MNLLWRPVTLNKHTSRQLFARFTVTHSITRVKLPSILTNSITKYCTLLKKNPVSLTATYWLLSAVEFQVETYLPFVTFPRNLPSLCYL